MDKKVFNWLGWLIAILYSICDIFLFIIGMRWANIGYSFGAFIAAVSMVAVIVGAALIPVWYDWALGKLLPCQEDIAMVVLKQTSVSHSQDATGPELTYVHQYITFQLLDGTRIVFKVRNDKWYTILMSERGMLTYKKQGNHTYFVDFSRF